jgi:exodeoxyribonuclease VII large subunit
MLNEEGFSVSEFIDLVNQTFEFAYPIINIVGELANFRISKNKWVYFDLKDEFSSLKFFGTVYSLSGPLEDGMMLKVTSNPKMHHLYGFSMQVQRIELVGEGTIKRAAEILQIKLSKEGLFDMDKKRQLPYPPAKIGLITSAQSAAYHDFVKITNNRWQGLKTSLIDVQVQGAVAASQIIEAIEYFNQHSDDIEVLVLIRGGGSPEDLAAFSAENVTRAVALSRIPTLVAIGHEIDVSLAELAADRRASTPSHAAELLVPDKRVILRNLDTNRQFLNKRVEESLSAVARELKERADQLRSVSKDKLSSLMNNLKHQGQLLAAYNPKLVLERGYSIVRKNGKVIRAASVISLDDTLDINLAKGNLTAKVKSIKA